MNPNPLFNLASTASFSIPRFLELSTRDGLQAAADEAVCLAVKDPRYMAFGLATAAIAEIETRIAYDGRGPLIAYQHYLSVLNPSDILSSKSRDVDFSGDILEKLALGMNDRDAWKERHWSKAVQGIIEAGGLADLTLAAERAFGLSGHDDSSRALARVRHLEHRLSLLENERLVPMSLTPRVSHRVRGHWSRPTHDSRRFLDMVHAAKRLHHALHEDDFLKNGPTGSDPSLHESLLSGRFPEYGFSLGLLTAHLFLAFGLSSYFDFPLADESLVMPLKLGLFFHPWEGLSSPKDWRTRVGTDASQGQNEDILYAFHLLRTAASTGKTDSILEGVKQMYPSLRIASR